MNNRNNRKKTGREANKSSAEMNNMETQTQTHTIEDAVQQVVFLRGEDRHCKTFYGAGDLSYSADDFEEEVKRIWSACRARTNDAKLSILTANIGPRVKAELRCQPEETQQDAEKALTKIVEIFGQRESSCILLQRLLSLRQEGMETVRTYSHRVYDAYKALTRRQAVLGEPIQNDLIVRDHFMVSLSDPILVRVLRDAVHKEPATSFRDLRETAIRWAGDEACPAALATATATAAATTVTAPVPAPVQEKDERILALEKMVKDLAETVSQYMKGPSSSKSNVKKCDRCHKIGHVGKDCRSRTEAGQTICYACHKPGHFARDCKEQGNAPPPQ